MCVDTHRGQKRVVGPLELELEMVVSPHVSVGNLGTKPDSSARVSCAIYPVPIAIINTHSLTSFYHYKVNKTNDPKEEKLQTKSKKLCFSSNWIPSYISIIGLSKSFPNTVCYFYLKFSLWIYTSLILTHVLYECCHGKYTSWGGRLSLVSCCLPNSRATVPVWVYVGLGSISLQFITLVREDASEERTTSSQCDHIGSTRWTCCSDPRSIFKEVTGTLRFQWERELRFYSLQADYIRQRDVWQPFISLYCASARWFQRNQYHYSCWRRVIWFQEGNWLLLLQG